MVVLGVNVPWDKEPSFRAFMEVYKVTYLVGRDVNGTISDRYAVDATPTSLFIDKAGRLVEQHVGSLEEAEFDKRIQMLL